MSSVGAAEPSISFWHHTLHPESLLWVVEAKKGRLAKTKHAPCDTEAGNDTGISINKQAKNITLLVKNVIKNHIIILTY